MNRIAAIRIIFWVTAFFSWHYSLSQNKELDSLSTILKTAKEDTSKIKVLKRIVFIWTDINPDSAKSYINQLRSLGNKINSSEGVIYADVKLAELYNMNGEYAEATKVNTANLAYALKKGTPYQTVNIYKTMAMGFSMQERNDSAIHYYLKALKVYEDAKDSLSMAKVMVNLGVVHDNMGDDKKAIEYCKRSKDIFKRKDRNAYLVTLTNLALYQAYEKQYAESEANYKEALQIALEDKNYNSLAHIYSDLTDLAYRKKEYPQMLPFAEKFEQIATEMQSEYMQLRAKLSMGKALFFNKRFDEAEKYFTEGLKQADQLENNVLLKDIYGMYSFLLLSKYNNINEFDKYRQKIDSLTGLANKDRITRATKELETQYETEKKDNQIKLQAASIQQRKIWNYFLAGLLIAIALLGLISVRSYRNKQALLQKEKALQQQKILQLEQEKQLAATQAVLQGQDEERSRLAKDLHDGLGGMLSGIKFSFRNMKENMIMTPDNQQAYARNMDMLDGIIHELRRIAHNMMPESLIKFGLDAALQDMCNYIQQTGALKINYQSLGLQGLSVDKNIAIHIYRIVQELLNNILKHAKATEAIVQVAYTNGLFSITTEDNGAGFDIAVLNKQSSNGMGWSSIRNRINSLKGNIDVQSSAQKGTSVFIEFNIQQS